MNLKSQKEDTEAVVRNIMLGDMRLGPDPTVSADTRVFLQLFTRPETLGDLFVTIQEITLN